MSELTQKENRLLTEWSGAEEYFTDEDGCPRRKMVNFNSIDNLFKYVVPKLPFIFVFDFAEGGWACFIRGCDGAPNKAVGEGFDPATALGRAVLKLLQELPE